MKTLLTIDRSSFPYIEVGDKLTITYGEKPYLVYAIDGPVLTLLNNSWFNRWRIKLRKWWDDFVEYHTCP